MTVAGFRWQLAKHQPSQRSQLFAPKCNLACFARSESALLVPGQARIRAGAPGETPSLLQPPKGQIPPSFMDTAALGNRVSISTRWKEGQQPGDCNVRISPDLVIPAAGPVLPGPARAGSGVPAEDGGCRLPHGPFAAPLPYGNTWAQARVSVPGALQAPLGCFCAAAEQNHRVVVWVFFFFLL